MFIYALWYIMSTLGHFGYVILSIYIIYNKLNNTKLMLKLEKSVKDLFKTK